ALRLIGDDLALWPACRCDPSAQVDQRFFGKADAERADVDIAPGLLFHRFLDHGDLLVLVRRGGHAMELALHIAQRPERRSNFLAEELRLLPGGEVAALVDLVEVD